MNFGPAQNLNLRSAGGKLLLHLYMPGKRQFFSAMVDLRPSAIGLWHWYDLDTLKHFQDRLLREWSQMIEFGVLGAPNTPTTIKLVQFDFRGP